jgi:threonine dehydratase
MSDLRAIAAPSANNGWPITLGDVEEARARLSAHLYPTPVREYPLLNDVVGNGIRVFVKHENHQPTNSFKVRNGLAAVSALPRDQRERGIVAASRGNYGLGLAYAGAVFGIPVTVCVPRENNPDKNAGMRALGATVLEDGSDYDEAVDLADRLARERSLTLVHATNNREVLAGAGTMALELIEQTTGLDAMIVAIGGGSVAVGAMTVFRSLQPTTRVYGVQAAGAATTYESWRSGNPVSSGPPQTFADGIATRGPYAMTYDALKEGLAGFVTVSDTEIAEALRTLVRTTHNLAEGAAAAGLAGLVRLRGELAGQRVAVVLTGSNIDYDTLEQVLRGEL